MEDTLLVHPTAQGLYEVFEKMPSTVREEFKAMISLPKKAKKKYADDTAYLSRNEASRSDLIKSLKEAREGKNLIFYTSEEWDSYVKETLAKIK